MCREVNGEKGRCPVPELRAAPPPRACGAGRCPDANLGDMKIPFAANWRKKHGPAHGVAVFPTGDEGGEGESGLVELLSECELLRSQADDAGVELDESVRSLEALDQLVPRWRRTRTRCTGWVTTRASIWVRSWCGMSRAPLG